MCFFFTMGNWWHQSLIMFFHGFNLYKSKFWICWIRSTSFSISSFAWTSHWQPEPRRSRSSLGSGVLTCYTSYCWSILGTTTSRHMRHMTWWHHPNVMEIAEIAEIAMFFFVFWDGPYSFCSVDLHSKILGHVISSIFGVSRYHWLMIIVCYCMFDPFDRPWMSGPPMSSLRLNDFLGTVVTDVVPTKINFHIFPPCFIDVSSLPHDQPLHFRANKQLGCQWGAGG